MAGGRKPEFLTWKQEVILEQQYCFDTLGTPMWREFEPSHYGELKRQIGYGLFGVPGEEPCENSNDGTGYRNKELKEINKIFDIFKNCTKNNPNPNNICVAFLFVFGMTKNECIKVPLIRILQFDTNFRQNVNRFIDLCGRVYDNWQDYLDNNTIPGSFLCYPSNGVYSEVNGAVEVEFGISPAGRTEAKDPKGLLSEYFEVSKTFIQGSVFASLIAGGLFLTSAPVATGIVGVSLLTGGIAAAWKSRYLKGLRELLQRSALYSVESRICWLGIGGFVFSAGTAAATADSNDQPLFTRSLTVSSCVVKGLAGSTEVTNIVDKVRNKEEITALDYFQLSSTILFFTHSVISENEAMPLVNTMGENSSGGSYVVLRDLMKRICESAPFMTYKRVPIFFAPLFLAVEKKELLFSVCNAVGIKLSEIIKRSSRGPTGMSNYMLESEELLGQFWDSWNKEMTEVVDSICQAFGVKHWSELVMGGCGITEYGHITAIANTLIVGNKSLLVQCGCTTTPARQREGISDNSAGVGTDDGPNSVVDGETHNYYDEIAHIFAKFFSQLTLKNSENFCSYMRLVCEFVKVQFQKKKSPYEKSLEMAKRFNPDVNVEEFQKEYGISGNPNDHFLQEVFKEFQSEERDVFTLLQLAYEKENAGTSAQEEDNGQGCLDADRVLFYPFDSMSGLDSNGMPNEQQYLELAGKLTGRHVDKESIYMSASGDIAVIELNAESNVITVRCWEEDGKVSGIAALLRNSAE